MEERDLTLAEGQSADEVFITSTDRDVQAITRWDDLAWDAPGPLTKRLLAEFQRRAADHPDP